jgi:hypothetical protein
VGILWVDNFCLLIVDYSLCILVLDTWRLSHLFGCDNKLFKTSILVVLYGQFVSYIAYIGEKNSNRPRRTKCVGPLGAPSTQTHMATTAAISASAAQRKRMRVVIFVTEIRRAVGDALRLEYLISLDSPTIP